MAMAESIVKSKTEKEERRVQEQKLKIDEQIAYYEDDSKLDRKTKRKLRLIKLAFTGQDLVDKKENVALSWRAPYSIFAFISIKSAEICD